MILILDNRDSFTFNLAQVLSEVGAEVSVRASRELDVAAIAALRPSGILIGPGPGGPREAGCSEAVWRELGDRLPILGVCLGHQALASAFGGRVEADEDLAHGMLRDVHHDGRGLFAGLPSPTAFARYNSLFVREEGLPDCLEVSARQADGRIMALRHRARPSVSVQFHPESILCVEDGGRALLANWLAGVAGALV